MTLVAKYEVQLDRRAAPMAREWAPWQPEAARRGGSGPWPVGAECGVLTAPAPGQVGCCVRRRGILLVLNPSIILGSTRAHFPGEHYTEYYTEYNKLSSYRV